ncbi:MAG: HNH endonuclease [Prosthecobacter sp.]|uniref:HNH endonuclease n=1 Tax=Prosthecobacter sp. TaxID=1965333 RepID=UPI001A0B4D0E|nr:HNH endonuclease [Prosthecobacter sp.]MBE2284909.1 HNH endonuclease [Prosthecobacter sp.]
MNEVLTKSTVLVLNRHWQAIDSKTPIEAFGMMAAGNATALDIHGEGDMRPVTWEEWLTLPVREGDNSIGTVHRPVRVPSVLVLARFDKVPKRRPKFCAKAIWERDGGVCQYTGRKLKPSEGNIDHVVPISRGGASTWENCVLADRKINSRKGSKLPEEAGLKLLRRPFVPRELPVTHLIKNHHKVRDWEVFLSGGSGVFEV